MQATAHTFFVLKVVPHHPWNAAPVAVTRAYVASHAILQMALTIPATLSYKGPA
jgi:hypothetical protein